MNPNDSQRSPVAILLRNLRMLLASVLLLLAVVVDGHSCSTNGQRPEPNQNNDIFVLQRSGAQIVGVSGFLNCDAMMCPWLSIFCYVQRDTLETDARQIRRLRVCMTREGERLNERQDFVKNILHLQENRPRFWLTPYQVRRQMNRFTILWKTMIRKIPIISKCLYCWINAESEKVRKSHMGIICSINTSLKFERYFFKHWRSIRNNA